METIREMLFENPWPIYVVLALTEFVLAGLWWSRRDKKILQWMIAPLVLAVAVFVLERIVVTDREQITINTNEIGRLIQSGQVEGLKTYLDENIRVKLADMGSDTANRDQVIQMGKAVLTQNPVAKISFLGLKVEPSGSLAEESVTTIIDFAGGELKDQKRAVKWIVRWGKKDGRWLINFAEAREAKPSDLGLPSAG